MQPVTENKQGSWVVGGEQAGQPEYLPLEIRRGEEGALWSSWVPSWRERLSLLFGGRVRLGILSTKQPPVFVTVEGRDFR